MQLYFQAGTTVLSFVKSLFLDFQRNFQIFVKMGQIFSSLMPTSKWTPEDDQDLRVTEPLPKVTSIHIRHERTAKSPEEILNKYMENIAPPEDEDCCICWENLTAQSVYAESEEEENCVVKLNKCIHMFHRHCILALCSRNSNGDCVKCPACMTIYGELIGNCPPGAMYYHIKSGSLRGYEGFKTIVITYNISGGIQGPEHPHPNSRYYAAFPRRAYLPDTNQGRKVLKMLMVAFQRKLTFTIGTSATTGWDDMVTWNEIHHKTEYWSNYTGHGYPDPNYLDNVTAELAVKGVTEDDVCF